MAPERTGPSGNKLVEFKSPPGEIYVCNSCAATVHPGSKLFADDLAQVDSRLCESCFLAPPAGRGTAVQWYGWALGANPGDVELLAGLQVARREAEREVEQVCVPTPFLRPEDEVDRLGLLGGLGGRDAAAGRGGPVAGARRQQVCRADDPDQAGCG